MPQNADPLIALGSEWELTRDEIDREDSDDVIDGLSARLAAIEKQMIPLVAMTSQGLAAQVRVLGDLVPGEDALKLVDNILAGLSLLLP